MTVDLLITNATIVNADSTIAGHIAVSGGRIVALYDSATSPELLPAAIRTLDAAGRTVIPGGVDSHAHVEQVTGAYKSLDTYETASIAALWGGTTTIMDFGIPADLSETPLAAAENKIRLAEVSRCDVALHGAVIDWDETVPAQLDRLAELGIRSVKMYTTNRGSTMANGDTIVKVMREMVRLDGLTYIHAEHDPIIVDCLAQHSIDEHGASVPVPAGRLHQTRPELAEAASVAEVLSMAEYTGAPVYFVHQTIPEAVALVQDARSRGLEAYSETCPHYLTLDEEVYASEFPEKFACCPPIRSRETVAALLERVKAGEVHTISSDHSCYDLAQKQSRSEDVRFMPHGLPGIETRMPVAFTTLVMEQGMAVQQFVELFAAGPARINKLAGKGIIAPGYDADLVIFDPDEVRTVDGKALHMGTDFSPFDGMELAGWPATVVMGGRVVLHAGEFTDPGPTGRFLNRYETSKMAALAGKGL
ncbi:amidohydrolase family protein [Paenarthrobacter sp. PH39-S1]|uniref:dihydroorotase n=1 Tax=Paenarthrobacter sp. PH39-S1 TaxID=3046204 RepID=UPI0024BA3B7B|nr:amidohydrolase family protein [Paenarthrobacter sp. PH39-S1]MDJ0355711.1 amidohydrolase family protein [Paenarthrobacter sp. PH39-S1]